MEIIQSNIYLPTGNEQVSIPTLYTDGRIENINIMSMKYRGLIEFSGNQEEPLIRPVLKVEEKELQGNLKWNRDEFWIPRFTYETDELLYEGEVCAPIGERGFYYHLKVTNRSNRSMECQIGLNGCWEKTLHSINESKEMKAEKRVFESNWNHSILFELMGEAPLFALAPMTDERIDIIETKHEGESDSIYYEMIHRRELEAGESTDVTFYWGVGLEEVGAATSAKEMLRKGRGTLRETTVKWLEERTLTTGNPKLDEVLNLNLFFNFFFATGQTIDTEEYVLVTSRSPRYYVSAAYWDRDSLLWSFPSILVTDSKRAKQMLDYVFTTQSRNIGIHSRYIDGVVLEPGFELDELCAPVIALHMYLNETDDWQYLEEPYIRKSLQQIIDSLASHRHQDVPLYDTFLQPTDDPIVYPYLTYNNVLVWKTLILLSEMRQYIPLSLTAERLEKMAAEVKKAIYKYMTQEEDGTRFFAWSIDMKGHYNIYDEPPGSMQLFEYYGFCEKADEIYQNTKKMIRSDKFPYSFKGCVFEELGCEHADHPWVLSIANSLLSDRKEQAKDILLRTPMDGGVACESIDEYTGISRTGDHFATCAGFLAYAIYVAFGQKKNRNHVISQSIQS